MFLFLPLMLLSHLGPVMALIFLLRNRNWQEWQRLSPWTRGATTGFIFATVRLLYITTLTLIVYLSGKGALLFFNAFFSEIMFINLTTPSFTGFPYKESPNIPAFLWMCFLMELTVWLGVFGVVSLVASCRNDRQPFIINNNSS